jgi:ribosomal protein S27AE/acyl carrier protein
MESKGTIRRIDKKEVIKELTLSCIEFFESSIKLIESNPKFSIVHFSTALELALKTRIAFQHWSLLLEKIDKNSSSSFLNGDFQSIQAASLVDKINGLYGKEIEDDEKCAYKEIFDHRNKIIHYYHSALTDKNRKDNIIGSEMSAWYYISKRIKKWSDSHLKPYKKEINNLIRHMSELKTYVNIVYKEIKPLIDKAKANGLFVCKCNICNKESRVEEYNKFEGIFTLVRTKCKICGFYGSRLLLCCPSCNYKTEFKEVESNSITCEKCGYEFNNKLEFVNGYDSDTKTMRTIYCPKCSHDAVVLAHENFYVCLKCGKFGPNTDTCEWCNSEFFSYDPQGSYINGCPLCDGSEL